MGLDQIVWVGAYVIASGPKFMGGQDPFDEWLYTDGDETLVRASDTDGAVIYIPNREWPMMGMSVPDRESMAPVELPGPEAIDHFEYFYESELKKLRESWRIVEVRMGVLSHVW